MTEQSLQNRSNSTGALKLVLAVLLLVSFIVNVFMALHIGVSKNQSNARESDTSDSTTQLPLSWFDQEQRDWLYHSPFKMSMRMLWIDCNRIVSAVKGGGQVAFDEIEVSALGIRRKAQELASLWKEVGVWLDGVSDASRAEDWLLTFEEYKGMWNACNDCHRYTWSPAYSHVTGAMLDAWLKGEHRPEMENEVDAEPPPMIPNRKIMQEMNVSAYGLEKGLATRNSERVEFETDKLVEEVSRRVAYWESISDKATKMLELAQDNEDQGMKQLYASMTSNCAGCHARTVGEIRTIMHPMVWE